MRTTLLIPTWNEIDGMRAILPRIDRSCVDQVLVVDHSSTDGTIEFAREQGLDVLIQQKPGLRNAYLEALPHVKGDVVILFSPDGNSVPEKIPPLVEKMRQGYDMVIVSRYAPGARSHDDDWLTSFGNWMFTALVNLLLRGRYTDVMVMFRAFRIGLIKDLKLDQDRGYRWLERLLGTPGVGFEPLMSARVASHKLRHADIPGDEPPRIGGSRKLLPFRWGLVVLYQIISELFTR